jgi:hypothetical protein
MRNIVVLTVTALILAGCSSEKQKPSTTPPPPLPKTIVTPDTVTTGKVVRVDDKAFFAVLRFPVGSLPVIGTRLGVYHQGLKVGEIKITGPQQEDITVGDTVSGEAQVGDEVHTQ